MPPHVMSGCSSNPRIFARALTEGGYRPEEVVYVGDSPAHDVAPVLLDRLERYPADAAYRRVSSLRELPGVLTLP